MIYLSFYCAFDSFSSFFTWHVYFDVKSYPTQTALIQTTTTNIADATPLDNFYVIFFFFCFSNIFLLVSIAFIFFIFIFTYYESYLHHKIHNWSKKNIYMKTHNFYSNEAKDFLILTSEQTSLLFFCFFCSFTVLLAHEIVEGVI